MTEIQKAWIDALESGDSGKTFAEIAQLIRENADDLFHSGAK